MAYFGPWEPMQSTMHDDGIDGFKDLEGCNIWDFPDGHGAPGVMKNKCMHWPLFAFLPSLDDPDEVFQPLAEDGDFDYYGYFHKLCKIHEGYNWIVWRGLRWQISYMRTNCKS